MTQSSQSRSALRHRVSSYKKICLKYQKQITNLGVVTIPEGQNPFPEINKLKSFPDVVICLCDVLDNLEHFAQAASIRIPEDLGVAVVTDFENLNKYAEFPHVVLDWSELVHQSILCLLGQIRNENPSPMKVLVKNRLRF